MTADLRGLVFFVKVHGCFYFRVFGWGLWFASYALHRPLFSERNGYVTAFRFWPGWRMIVLRPGK